MLKTEPLTLLLVMVMTTFHSTTIAPISSHGSLEQDEKISAQSLDQILEAASELDSPSTLEQTARKEQSQLLQEVLQPATSKQSSVYINQSLTLPKNSKISKQLIFEGDQATNLIFDANGADIQALYSQPSILISSKQQQDVWQVPHHITIKNATIKGALRIHGMAANGEGELLKQSSHQTGHTVRAQQAAPHHIQLDHLRLIAGKHNMMYLAPGVHHVTLKNSHFVGKTPALALYLDAESSHNTIENNQFDVQTKTREVIAIDGSAHNIIHRNTFINPQHGAIYVYRNCGEGGTVRHQAPEYNQITQNYFQVSSNSKLPLVWLASRNGRRNYCDADQGYNFGSSMNNHDLATHNTVTQNFFNLKKLPTWYRWTMNAKARVIRMNDQPNESQHNEITH